jgi:hypothetical protein
MQPMARVTLYNSRGIEPDELPDCSTPQPHASRAFFVVSRKVKRSLGC